MKNLYFPIAAVILLFVNSCATLNINEIRDLRMHTFDTLILEPAYEIHERRIDIIRQSYEEQVNDSTVESKDTPYHVLGFNLGNGLFFDLNQNLSLRVDELLGFSPLEDFELEREYRSFNKRKGSIFRFSDGVMYTERPSGRGRDRENYRLGIASDSLNRYYKDRFRYALVRTDTSLVYRGKRRIFDAIYERGENCYALRKRSNKRIFRLSGSEIDLQGNYCICLSEDNRSLELRRRGMRKDRTIYTIRKDGNTIFIYDKKHRGKKLVLDEGQLRVYHNRRLQYIYKLI